MVGRTLAHYKILQKLGAGGMGEVYVAEDTKLSRKVALKVLPPEMASSERLKRFEREAKAVAALDHPNIVTIFSVEEADGVNFITMQLVKGKTLTELIPENGVSLSEFFEIAVPLADAVSAAHQEGITHRDLKPDNLMVSDEGRLKVLDFGLAKLRPEFGEPGMSELPTQSMTQEGRIVGTVAYMSPEQAEGSRVDHRSDIFSLGIIFYQLVTGRCPFRGKSAAGILSSILRDTPESVSEVNRNLPANLGKIIGRCLVKDPERRYQSAKDIRNELEELKQDVESGVVFKRRPPIAWPSIGRNWAPVVAFVSLAAMGIYLLMRPEPERTESRPLVGALTQLTSQTGLEDGPSLSPDGDTLAYESKQSGNWDIYIQRVGGERSINLTEDSPVDDYSPVFSPDGEHIAFCSDRGGGGIFLMGATGESARRLTDFGCNPAWSSDGKEIVFGSLYVHSVGNRGTLSQLWIVNVETGETHQLNTDGDAAQPSWSPNGSRIAYWAIDEGKRDIWTIPATGGEAVQLTYDESIDWNPVWSPDGKYVYFSSDRSGSENLWRVPVDEDSGKSLGEPEPVTTVASTRVRYPSISSDGRRIAYVERVTWSNINRVAFDAKTGKVRGEPQSITRSTRYLEFPDVSPDGNWVTFSRGGEQEDIFIVRTDGTGLRQLTDDPHLDRVPRWSPDGETITFFSNRSGTFHIWAINRDGGGLHQLVEQRSLVHTWSPDGSRIAFNDNLEKRSYIVDPNKPRENQVPLALPPLEDEQEWFCPSSWSPDGRLLAGWARLTADGTSTGVTVYSLESQKYQRLTDFGELPRWLADGRRLLFDARGGIYLTDREPGETEIILPIRGKLAVSSDNGWIYFSRSTVEADIWMLTLN
jgi:Tol biopolymer transport system component